MRKGPLDHSSRFSLYLSSWQFFSPQFLNEITEKKNLFDGYVQRFSMTFSNWILKGFSVPIFIFSNKSLKPYPKK